MKSHSNLDEMCAEVIKEPQGSPLSFRGKWVTWRYDIPVNSIQLWEIKYDKWKNPAFYKPVSPVFPYRVYIYLLKHAKMPFFETIMDLTEDEIDYINLTEIVGGKDNVVQN